MYPQQGNGQWDDDSAGRAIENILKGVRKLNHIDKNVVETINKAVGKLSSMDPELALELASIGERVDPKNRELLKKIDALKNVSN